MGFRQDITTGEAVIRSTVNGTEPKDYSAVIESINYNSSEPSKNMVIRITDPELIEASGGIVQGMSAAQIEQLTGIAAAMSR